MMPGMNPRQMQKAMKKLGMQQEEIDAVAVIIRTKKEDIIIREPSVLKMNMMGQDSYQISGTEEVRRIEPEFSEEDIKMVMEQGSCSEEKAKQVLKDTDGDLAQAIINLQG